MKIITYLLLVSSLFAVERERFDSIMSLINSSKWEKVESELVTLKIDNEDDPEYYVLVINYAYGKSRNEVIQLDTQPPKEGTKVLELTKKDSSDVVGYMYGKVAIDKETLFEGLKEFKIGLKKFPNRLDMHFGFAHVTREATMYEDLSNCLIDMINISKKNNNDWSWSFGEKKEDGYNFMTENIQSYIYTLFQNSSEKTDSLIISISNCLIKNYPNLLYGYNNIGSIKSVQGQFKEAIDYFEKAYGIDKNDGIVLSNLVVNYLKDNNKSKAKEYCHLMLKLDTQQSKEWAEKMLIEIDKN